MYCSTISQSKASIFKQCKLKYRYRYVDRIDEEQSNADAMHFGSYIHKIFEDGIQATTYKELEDLAKKHAPNYAFDDSYKAKTEGCLKNFLRLNASLNEVGDAELIYEVDAADDITLNGIIDRVIQGTDGGYLIIDYKTGKREKTKLDLFDDEQLQGYCYALHKLKNIPIKDITVAHYYPISDNLVSLQYSDAQISSYLRNKIEEVWKIRKCTKSDLGPSRNQFCNWCGYKYVCPIFNDSTLVKKRLDEVKKKSSKK